MCNFGLKRLAPDEVMVELDAVRPAQLNGTPIPRADVIGLEAPGEVKGDSIRRHGRL